MPDGDQRSGGLRQAETDARTVDVVVDARNAVAHGPYKRGIEENGPLNAPKYFFYLYLFKILLTPYHSNIHGF